VLQPVSIVSPSVKHEQGAEGILGSTESATSKAQEENGGKTQPPTPPICAKRVIQRKTLITCFLIHLCAVFSK
jgi:hypothetical protein